MKLNRKFNWVLALAMAGTFASCRDTEGSDPGTDPNPSVIVYTYATSTPYNPDNDVRVRFATNSATESLYYLVEPTATAEAFIKSKGENAYFDYVVSNGIKVAEAKGAGNFDVTIEGLVGEYSITAVATHGGAKGSNKGTFMGLDWENIVDGSFDFGFIANKGTIPQGSYTSLQVCTTDDKLYRLKDVFGEGYSLKMYMMGVEMKDSDGDVFELFRYYKTPTSYTFGQHGTIYMQDIAAWQGSDSFAKNANYMNYMYKSDKFCVLRPYVFVGAGYLGYGQGANSCYFIPND